MLYAIRYMCARIIYEHAPPLPQPNNGLRSLSVKNCHTAEMCRNLTESLVSGRLPHLESLALIQVSR